MSISRLALFNGKYDPPEAKKDENCDDEGFGGLGEGGAYQLKSELFEGDILTVLSGLTELTEKLEMLGSEKEMKKVCYVM